MSPACRVFSRRDCLRVLLGGAAWLTGSAASHAQKFQWRQATAAELAAALPARVSVEQERIETEMRTASGVIDSRGRVVAGVVLLTAGYSADGKYSHYLLVEVPIRIDGLRLPAGQYAFGWIRGQDHDTLLVHFNQASNGQIVGSVLARRFLDPIRLESLHIWPPAERSTIQIGRFQIPYRIENE